MDIGKYHLGWRTGKTSLAVMVCIIFFDLTNRGTPIVATLAAVFALREDMSTSVTFGKSRIIGNTLGGVNAFIYSILIEMVPNRSLGQIILVPLFVTLTIVISLRLNNEKGIIGSVATLLFICFSIPKNESFVYAFQRVIDTFIGTFIAFGVNYFLKSPTEHTEETIEDMEELIILKEQEILSLKEDIQQLQKK